MIRKLRLIWWLIRSDRWVIRVYPKGMKDSKLDIKASAAEVDDTLFRIGEAAYTADLQDAAVELTNNILNKKN